MGHRVLPVVIKFPYFRDYFYGNGNRKSTEMHGKGNGNPNIPGGGSLCDVFLLFSCSYRGNRGVLVSVVQNDVGPWGGNRIHRFLRLQTSLSSCENCKSLDVEFLNFLLLNSDCRSHRTLRNWRSRNFGSCNWSRNSDYGCYFYCCGYCELFFVYNPSKKVLDKF